MSSVTWMTVDTASPTTSVHLMLVIFKALLLLTIVTVDTSGELCCRGPPEWERGVIHYYFLKLLSQIFGCNQPLHHYGSSQIGDQLRYIQNSKREIFHLSCVSDLAVNCPEHTCATPDGDKVTKPIKVYQSMYQCMNHHHNDCDCDTAKHSVVLERIHIWWKLMCYSIISIWSKLRGYTWFLNHFTSTIMPQSLHGSIHKAVNR